MDESPLQLIVEIGDHLAMLSRPNKDSLVKSLRQAASALSQIELSPETSKDAEAMKKVKGAVDPLRKSILKHGLLRHNDKDVKLLLAICVSETFRIMAPDPPFQDKYLRDVFKLILSMFAELGDTSSPYFSRRVKILETVAHCKCCVIMLDVDCNDLVLEMFNTFFSVVRECHQKSLFDDILSIMTYILNEEASNVLLDAILRNLVKEAKDASSASSQLAVSVIQTCAETLEPLVCGFLTSCSLDRDSVESDLKEFYHEILFKIFQFAPQMLLAVIPNLKEELLMDQVDVRRKAVKITGQLFALHGQYLVKNYQNLFVEFKNRFSDKSPEVRVSAIQSAKVFYMANPTGKESREVLAALEERFLDFDDKIRTEAVVVACDLAKSNLKFFPPELVSKSIERLRDKKISVRKTALQKLMDLYREYCNMCAEGHMMPSDDFEQIPCKVLMLTYEKDCKEFRTQCMDAIIAEDLFPTLLSVDEVTKHWIHIFSLFTHLHVKALTSILSHKRRLQTEMQTYLSSRKKEKDISAEEIQQRIKKSFLKMSAFFPDPSRAEEGLHNLNQMKDNHIFDALESLLNDHAFMNAQKARDKFVKMIGYKHPNFAFLLLLSSKCAFNIFGTEHVSCILDHVSRNGSRNGHLEAPAAKLFLVISSIFPSLLRGSEEQLLMLLERGRINDTMIEALGKVGSELSDNFSKFYPILEKMCLDGTRFQSKHAVSAIASLSGSTEQQIILSKLCKKIVDSLHNGCKTSTLLQSLGCIAQYSVSAFEDQNREIRSFLFERILQEEASYGSISSERTSNCTDACKLKIHGLKMLVKSFLPHRGSHVKQDFNELLDILLKMLHNVGPFGGALLCEPDKPHIRLAAAISVLRLSRRWDLHISPEIFRHTMLMAKDSSSFACRLFLDKTNKLLKARAIPTKYACAFTLAASDCRKDIRDASSKYMQEFIVDYNREARIHQSTAVKGVSATDYPAYIVVFLIHVLAHDADFPPVGSKDAKTFAQFCSPLFWVLKALINSNVTNDGKDMNDDVVSYLLGILRAIKKAEDVVDAEATPKLQILAEIGISVVNELSVVKNSTSCGTGMVLLPSSLFKISPLRKCTEVNPKCPTQISVSEGFVKRVVDSLKSQVSTSKKTAHPDVRSGNRRKHVLSPTASESGELQCEHSAFELQKNNASGGSKSFVEKEQCSGSCDPATMVHSLAGSEVSILNMDRMVSPMKEKAGPSYDNTTQFAQKSLAKTKENSHLSCSSSNDNHKVSYDGRDSELLSLDSESQETICGISLGEKEILLAGQSNASTKQPKRFVKRKNEKLIAKKEKRLKGFSDTLPSEVINCNEDAVARRTRRRKL